MAQRLALGEFLQWESQNWVEAVADLASDEKEYFMPLEVLKKYFTADDNKKLNQILIEIFDTNFPPIDPELILRDHAAIFCILLRIGQGTYIEHFARYEELSDRRLPFDPNHPPEEFPDAQNDPKFLQRFCERQRMYCVPIFDCHMLHKHFGRNRLLPIIYKESQGQEGMASKYMIKIHGPHNKLLPVSKNAVPNNNPYANTFVLKSYATKENERYYTQEVNGFRSVKNTESIVKFYGSYIHGNDFNILLEYADRGCLADYFQNETPPSRGVDIIRFWESLFQLVKGLKAIHSTREGHHNVTTQSILVLSNNSEGCQFKFADFGLHNPKPEQSPNGETPHSTYNPPECYSPFSDAQTRRSSPKLTWAGDIWSLGCIYSEAAIWIADGYKGLEDYRKQRVDETDRILFKGGDCFHDGERVLQSVLNAHSELEDRLRRTDYITKEVLDSMVDEMLWEEDRPNAKALWRKAEMISTRARQKLSANSGDEFSRPPSSLGRALPPRREPPTQPLPPIPRLSSIAERQYPPNVEKWRSQIANSQGQPRLNRQASTTASTVTSDSLPDLDREIDGSIASWQMGDNSSVASPITPFTSPHASVYNDYAGRTPMEMRANSIRSQNTYLSSNPPRVPPRAMSYMGSQAPSDYGSVAPSIAPSIPQSAAQSVAPSVTPSASLSQRDVPINVSREQNYSYSPKTMNLLERGSQVNTPTLDNNFSKALDEATSVSRTASRSGSRHSVYSTSRSHHSDETQYRSQMDDAPPKSRKRMGGFSLFPSRNRHEATPSPDTIRAGSKTPSHHDDSVPRSSRAQSLSTSSGFGSWAPEPGGPPDYLSLNTCLEWKKAHKVKKAKKQKVPPLPGANLLEDIKDRDHVFIIDDSASMQPVWADVKRVFEALSYVVKGMSPDGTELFFTISFETWRRKDTFDLCTYLEKKKTNGQTNIAWRLNLQLELYRAKIWSTRSGKKPLRPMSFYILTNGEWGKGADPKVTIKQTADLLMQHGMLGGQVTIEFISFAQTASGMQHISGITNTDFGVNIVDSERWTGNVLKMLKGPIDKHIWANEPDDQGFRSPGMNADSVFTPPRSSSIVNELA